MKVIALDPSGSLLGVLVACFCKRKQEDDREVISKPHPDGRGGVPSPPAMEEEQNFSADGVETMSPPSGFEIATFDRIRMQKLLEKATTIKQLEKYIKAIEAKYAVVEEEYVDKDFLDDYVSYYARCFRDYPRKCCRVHFFKFDEEFDKAKLENLILRYKAIDDQSKDFGAESLQNAYLGFIVFRPLQETIVGRTCLIPYSPMKPNDPSASGRHYPAVCTNHVSFFGIDLQVKCMPFQEQDRAVSACATCALWSAFSVSAPNFGNRVLSPSAITALAMENCTSPNRKFPNHGLTDVEMCSAIRKAGLDPVVIQFTNWKDLKSRDYIFLGAVYAYLNLGISVIAILRYEDEKGSEVGGNQGGAANNTAIGRHAVALNGYRIREGNGDKGDSAWKWLSAMRIEELYANDDACCPGAKFTPKLNQKDLEFREKRRIPDSDQEARLVVESLIVPLYHKIRVTFEEIGNDVEKCVGCLNAGKEARVDCQSQSEERVDIELDITLRTSGGVKADVRKDTVFPDAKKIGFLSQSLPRFVWCVRFRLNGKPAALVIIDATDSGQGLNVDGVLFYSDVNGGRNMISDCAKYVYAHKNRLTDEQRAYLEKPNIFSALVGLGGSFKDLQKKAEGGDATSAYNLGFICNFGLCGIADATGAKRWYQEAVEKGHLQAKFDLAILYRDEKNFEDAVALLKELSDGESQFELGMILRDEEFPQRNEAEAIECFCKATEQGEVRALRELVKIRADPNHQERIDKFLQSQERREVIPMLRGLVSAYLGSDCKEDAVEMLKVVERLKIEPSEFGPAQLLCRIGCLYAYGWGPLANKNKDEQKAIRWLEAAQPQKFEAQSDVFKDAARFLRRSEQKRNGQKPMIRKIDVNSPPGERS